MEHRAERTDLPYIYCAAELGFAACVNATMVRLLSVLIADVYGGLKSKDVQICEAPTDI